MEAQSAFKMGTYARDFCYFLPGFHSEMAEARTRDCQQTFYHPDKQNKNIFRPLQMRIISSFKMNDTTKSASNKVCEYCWRGEAEVGD